MGRKMRLAIIAMSLAASANAATVMVSLNLTGLPSGSYFADYQFINGDNVAGNNLATISGFSSSGLGLGGLSTFGTVSGSSLVTGVTLADGPVTEVDQAFTASGVSAMLSFTLVFSTNYAAPGPGDAFTFAITDTSLNSTRSAGNGAEIEIDFVGSNPTISVFSSDPGFGGFQAAVQSPAVPESPAALFVAFGILLIAWRLRPPLSNSFRVGSNKAASFTKPTMRNLAGQVSLSSD